MTLKQFSKQYHEWKELKAIESVPDGQEPFPYIKRSRFVDSTEKGLLNCIDHHCKMNGYGFSVYDSRGHMGSSGKFHFSKMSKGRGDCFITIPVTCDEGLGGRTLYLSKMVWVEIKIGKDYQKPHQKKFEDECMERHEAYILPKNWNDYYMMINAIAEKL